MIAQSINLDIAYDNRRNITCRRGDKFQYRINTIDERGDAVDFTGAAEIRCQIKKGNANKLLFVIDDGITVTPTYIELRKGSEEMDALTPGIYEYDIEVEDNAGDITTISAGTIHIREDITQ